MMIRMKFAARIVCVSIAAGIFDPTLHAQATRPATAPAVDVDQPTPPLAEDLVANPSEYSLGPNDLVQVSLTGLTAPDVETKKVVRIGKEGMVTLPVIGSIKFAGLTEDQAEEAIREISPAVKADVRVREQRGHAFHISGDVPQTGQYMIPNPDFRLTNALMAARATPKDQLIRVVRRKPDGTTRVIGVAGAELAAGNQNLNIVIRPNDLILVGDPASRRSQPQ